jgi:hypothetical protein
MNRQPRFDVTVEAAVELVKDLGKSTARCCLSAITSALCWKPVIDVIALAKWLNAAQLKA